MSIVEFDTVSYGYTSRTKTQRPSDGSAHHDEGSAAPTAPAVSVAPTTSAVPTALATSVTPTAPAAFAVPTAPATPAASVTRFALDGVSLSIEPGEFVAVIGANGSGKSTLAKHINALLVPQSGRVLTLGLDTSDDEVTFEIRSHAGMVFQNPDSQIVASVVADDIAFGPENLAVPYDELLVRIDDALGAVKMEAFSQRNPTRLSGGQKQRVCIAGILAMRPDVLVLDEPGAMLDTRGRRGIRRIVRELNDGGMTVILITHFMEEAVLAGRVLVISDGRIALAGSPFEVFSQKDLLRELALDVPFPLLLAEELRKRGVPVSDNVNPEELKEELWRWHSSR